MPCITHYFDTPALGPVVKVVTCHGRAPRRSRWVVCEVRGCLRDANHLCATCGIPICGSCAAAHGPGSTRAHYCPKCAPAAGAPPQSRQGSLF